MRKTTADLTLRPRRPSDDAFIYPLSDRIFAAYSIHPTGSMASMLAEGGALAFVAERAAAPLAPPRGRPSRSASSCSASRAPARGASGPWQRPAAARLNAIGVQPDLHGSGVGRFLLDRAEVLARDAGAVSPSP